MILVALILGKNTNISSYIALGPIFLGFASLFTH